VGNISRHISAREDSGLSTKHIMVIATLSTAVPVIVCVAAVFVCILKQRRALERRKADDEARRQNEQNSVHSSAIVASSKHGDAHMIKNTWSSPCVKNTEEADWEPVYTLHRSRSQKQLNTEVRPPPNRTSSKDLDNLARSDKRVSLLQVDSSHSHTR
jgi:Golgi apparatus protein 1